MFWWNPQDVLLMGTFWTDWCSLSNSNAKKTSFLMNPSVLLHLHSVCSLDTLYKLLYTLVIHWRTYMMLCQEEQCSFSIPRDLVWSVSLLNRFWWPSVHLTMMMIRVPPSWHRYFRLLSISRSAWWWPGWWSRPPPPPSCAAPAPPSSGQGLLHWKPRGCEALSLVSFTIKDKMKS